MKDTFGRTIKKDDLVLYCTRRGSSQDMQIARVVEDLFDNCIKVQTVAGTSYEWREGAYDFKNNKNVPYTGRATTLTQPHNVIIVNGIDVDSIKRRLETSQTRAA